MSGFKPFKISLKNIDAFDAEANGTTLYGINAMADLSPEEFKANYLGFTMPSEPDRRLREVVEVETFRGESKSVDWRGIHTMPIKYQGGCGSCW